MPASDFRLNLKAGRVRASGPENAWHITTSIHTMNENGKISYVEFPAKDIPATKAFFQTVFGWAFKDYGPDYVSFADHGLDGGFYHSGLCSSREQGAALVVLYSKDLESTQQRVEQAGGVISTPIFSFPGGRRFHFIEPSGNELAVWSDAGA